MRLLVPCLLAVVLSGCLLEERGPVEVKVLAFQVEDPLNITMVLRFENTGQHDVRNISGVGRFMVVGPNGSDVFHGSTWSNLTNRSQTFGGGSSIRPGEHIDAMLRGRLERENGRPIRPEDIQPQHAYSILIPLRYLEDGHPWYSAMSVGCYHIDGTVANYNGCGYRFDKKD